MPEPVGIVLDRVSVRFGDTVALDNVSLEIEPGEFFSLLGPSGCGKTTLLRVIGGFETPQQGRVLIGGRDVTGIRPQERPTAMVFQSYALFPGMTVAENVGYGLRVRRVARAKRSEIVGSALARVGLTGVEERNVALLSGGQQQRVALARAIAVEPDVLLFDEPLSNLDVALRERTRQELRIVQRQVGHTSVYVTHDQQEALGLSDRIAVMRAGGIVQVDTPEKLFAEPRTAYVASFLGGANIVSDPGIAARLVPTGAANDGLVLAVRPPDLVRSAEGLEVDVVSNQFLGYHRDVGLRTADGRELRAYWSEPVEVGSRVRVTAEAFRWVVPD